MQNETIKNLAKDLLKELLSQCNDQQQLIFKRMYCHKNLEASIDEAVNQMEDSKIDWAVAQVEQTLKNAKL